MRTERERKSKGGSRNGDIAQHVLVRKWTGSKCKYDASRGNGTRQLRDAVQNEPRRPDATKEEESEADVGIEEPARRAEEEPCGDEQAEPESRRDVERTLEVRPLYCFMRPLGPTERQEQKHGRPDKFDGGRLGIVDERRLWPVIFEKRRRLFHHRGKKIKRFQERKLLKEYKYIAVGCYIVRPVLVDCAVVDTPTGPKASGDFQTAPVSILPINTGAIGPPCVRVRHPAGVRIEVFATSKERQPPFQCGARSPSS